MWEGLIFFAGVSIVLLVIPDCKLLFSPLEPVQVLRLKIKNHKSKRPKKSLKTSFLRSLLQLRSSDQSFSVEVEIEDFLRRYVNF